MMNFSGLLKVLAEKFNGEGVPYALIGGFAMHAAGLSRATGDVDLLVDAKDQEKVKAILLSLGYKILFENENVMNLAAPWMLIGGIDILWARRPYSLEMIRTAGISPMAGMAIPVVSPESIIGLKVQAMVNDPERRLRDMADIEWLVKEHHDNMDMVLVRQYFDLFSMGKDLEELLQRLGYAH